ncbi:MULTISPECIES: carboxymuconolactone decarboxylase family protein [Actinosynnema]|uniref:carboxymuconolactone decarboxylase family protein n=1 Tax=Actinosynnema TaxID=40566 RepID=UPI0020A2BECF|nr:carboxymuconolactone decarboxylase family protein [Actinosynnema pretiosum]MCP2094953.1 alkylhydroperoxidase AhpD family core domain-containing protein [Actinosynnema pretiosum]
MAQFTAHDETTAPERSRPLLAAARNRTGAVTGLAAVMAESPELLAGYQALAEQFGRSSLPAPAKHVVWLAASVENDCGYCVAAHSALALKSGVDAAVVAALRAGDPLPDESLDAVRALTRAVVADRGFVADDVVERFLAAGHTRRHVLDVVLGVGMKTLSNYTNHLAGTPLDPAWADQEWHR